MCCLYTSWRLKRIQRKIMVSEEKRAFQLRSPAYPGAITNARPTSEKVERNIQVAAHLHDASQLTGRTMLLLGLCHLYNVARITFPRIISNKFYSSSSILAIRDYSLRKNIKMIRLCGILFIIPAIICIENSTGLRLPPPVI